MYIYIINNWCGELFLENESVCWINDNRSFQLLFYLNINLYVKVLPEIDSIQRWRHKRYNVYIMCISIWIKLLLMLSPHAELLRLQAIVWNCWAMLTTTIIYCIKWEIQNTKSENLSLIIMAVVSWLTLSPRFDAFIWKETRCYSL